MKLLQLSEKVAQNYGSPSNLIESDAMVFSDDLQRECPASFISYHRYVFVSHHGVIFNGFRFSNINLTDTNKWVTQKGVGWKTYLRVLKNRQSVSAEHSYILPFDNWSVNYFHFLLDLLPKIFYASKRIDDPVVVLPGNFPAPFLLFLDQIGITNILLIRKHKWAFFRTLLVPELIFKPSGVFNRQYLVPFRDWLNSATASPAGSVPARRKIYLSRRAATSRRVINEEAVCGLLKELGFEIHCAEDMTVWEQVCLFREAGVFLSAHGAGLSNMLFMPEGSAVVELRLHTSSANNTFFRLASSLNHRYYYLKCSGDKEAFQDANLYVETEQLRDLLKLLPQHAVA